MRINKYQTNTLEDGSRPPLEGELLTDVASFRIEKIDGQSGDLVEGTIFEVKIADGTIIGNFTIGRGFDYPVVVGQVNYPYK